MYIGVSIYVHIAFMKYIEISVHFRNTLNYTKVWFGHLPKMQSQFDY